MINKEAKYRALAFVNAEPWKEATDYLLDRAVRDLLNADNQEAREEKWRTYQAIKGVKTVIAKWAEEARTDRQE